MCIFSTHFDCGLHVNSDQLEKCCILRPGPIDWKSFNSEK